MPGIFSWYQNHLINLNLAKLCVLHKNNAERRFWLWSMYKLEQYLDIFIAYHPLSKFKDDGMFVDDFYYSSLSKNLRNYKYLNIYNYFLPLFFSANFTFFNFYKKVKYISDLPDFFYFVDDPFYENFFFNLLVAPKTFYTFLNHCMETKIPYLSRLAEVQLVSNGEMWPMDNKWNLVMARDSSCHNYLFNFFYFFEENYNWYWLPDWIYHKSSIFNFYNFNDAFSKYSNFYSQNLDSGLNLRFWDNFDHDEFYIMRAGFEEVEYNEDDLDYNEDDVIFAYWCLIPFIATSVINCYIPASSMDLHDEATLVEYQLLFHFFFHNTLVNYYFPFFEIIGEWITYVILGEGGIGGEMPLLTTLDSLNFLKVTIDELTIFSEASSNITDSTLEYEEIFQLLNDPLSNVEIFHVYISFFKKWFFNDYKYVIPFIDIVDEYSFFFRYTNYPESFLYNDSRFYYNKYPFSFYFYNNSEFSFYFYNKKSSFIDFFYSGFLRFFSYIFSFGFPRFQIGAPCKIEFLRESFPFFIFFIKFFYYVKHFYYFFFYIGFSFYISFSLFFYNILCLDDISLIFIFLFILCIYLFLKKKRFYIFSKRVKNLNYDTLFQLKFFLRLKRKLRDLSK